MDEADIAEPTGKQPGAILAPHAKDVIDIIKAPGQFAGFQHYPNYSADLVERLQSIINIANNPKDKRSGAYTTFFKTV